MITPATLTIPWIEPASPWPAPQSSGTHDEARVDRDRVHCTPLSQPQNKEYATQVRQDYETLQEEWPDTEFLWSWRKSYTKDTTRKAKGNAQADKLADRGMRMAAPQPRSATKPHRLPPPLLPYIPFRPKHQTPT